MLSENNTGDSYTWAVNVNNSDSSQPYYYLYFENEDDNSQHYYSALFRVDNPVDAESTGTAAATVTIIPSPSLQASTSANGATTVIITKAIIPSPTTASATSMSTIGAAGASSTSTTSNGSSSGLSQSAKIGIGVGVGVPLGVLLIVALVVFAVWRHSRAAKRTPEAIGMYAGPGTGGYANSGLPPTAAAGYGEQQSAYNQHGEKLAKQGVHGYAPVPQPGLVPGIHELAQNTTEPQELGTYDPGHDSGYRNYR